MCHGHCHLATLSNLKRQMPQPCLLHIVASHEIKAEIWSICTETDQEVWDVIQVKPQRPLSVHTWGWWNELNRHYQCVPGWHHRNLHRLSTEYHQTGPGQGLSLGAQRQPGVPGVGLGVPWSLVSAQRQWGWLWLWSHGFSHGRHC